MSKRVTRIEKYKEYRDEILNTKDSISSETNAETLFNKLNKKSDKKVASQQPVNKHLLEKKEQKELEKSVYSIYTSKKRLKRFLYFLFVIAVVGGLIALFLVLGNMYLGFDL